MQAGDFQNPWMLENCRASCQACYDIGELLQICRTFKGRRPRSVNVGGAASSFLAAIHDFGESGGEPLDVSSIETV